MPQTWERNSQEKKNRLSHSLQERRHFEKMRNARVKFERKNGRRPPKSSGKAPGKKLSLTKTTCCKCSYSVQIADLCLPHLCGDTTGLVLDFLNLDSQVVRPSPAKATSLSLVEEFFEKKNVLVDLVVGYLFDSYTIHRPLSGQATLYVQLHKTRRSRHSVHWACYTELARDDNPTAIFFSKKFTFKCPMPSCAKTSCVRL